MKTKLSVIALLAFTASASADDRIPGTALAGRVTDTTTGEVVAGAQVFVSGPSGLIATAVTDAAGTYNVSLAPGNYNVIFVHGRTRTSGNITVGDQPATFNGKVDVASGETIIIEEHLKPPVPPKPKNYVASKTPPYSDAAVLSDAWTTAWMLLDVNPQGRVERIKFLKHPGYDLEEIAKKEASRLEFEPARDRFGKAVRTWMVWKIEWPSAWWLEQMVGTRSGMPPIIGYDWDGNPVRKDWYVPCAGSGPMNLGSIHPAYKDCSKPDLKAALKEPWLQPVK
jgi:carboxypeptidase family protein